MITEDGIPGRMTAATVQGSEGLRGSMASEGNSRASELAGRVFAGAGMVSEGAGRASEARWKGLRGMGVYGAPSTPSPEGAGVGHKMASVTK